MKRNSLFLLPLLFALASCEPDKELSNFRLDIKGLHNDQPLVLGQTYQNEQGYKFNIQTLRFYLSDITLTRSDGSTFIVKSVDYINFENNHAVAGEAGETVAIDAIDPGTYTSVRFAIGVDSALNFSDPASYESTHPLSIYTGAHWNWNTGYIFTKIEGNIDSAPNGSGTLENGFLYHMGTMPLYREVLFEEDFTVAEGETAEYKVKLDIDRLFYSDTDTLDAVNDKITHTTDNFPLAERVTDLFVGAFSKR